ncbi:MAG: SDR family oxidoreductase [Planctomycetes bacterium]|nr:SDR family oxidoreductase [Planctomycetota bacterium]
MALYLVTGGAGFIGSHLVHALVARGDRVRVLDDLSTGRLENLSELETSETAGAAPVQVMRGSITNPLHCKRACEGVLGVFHEAAQVSVPKSIEAPVDSYEINVMGTLRVLEAARVQGVKRVVFAASSAAYGNTATLPKIESMPPEPLSPYASGKLAGEALLRVYGHAYGMNTVSLRYFNVFGPRQLDDSPYTGVIAIFARALLDNRAPTIYGDGEQTRDLTYIDNVVSANLLAMESDLPPGSVINVGGGERITINELYRTMAGLLGSKLAARHAPARAGDVLHSLASIERARELLGYSPSVSWRDGLAQTVAWYRSRAAVASR